MGKTIKIDPVTRIEGHGRILLDCDDDGKVEEAYFCVNELRGFERILVGMDAATMPSVTARICGVCPTAHHLVAAKALDAAAGVTPPVAGQLLREYMYMGHVIHSHALSLFILAGPDLVFGLNGDAAKQNIVGMVEAYPGLAKKGLRLRSLGQKINEAIGGRGIHPVTAVAGGITFKLNDDHFKKLQELTAEAVSLSVQLAGVLKKLLLKLYKDNPVLLSGLNQPSWYAGSLKDGKVNFYDGIIRVCDETGAIRKEFTASEYTDYVVERTVSHSYAKETFIEIDGEERMYRVGPLARLNIADGMETPVAQAEFEEFRKRFGKPSHNVVAQMYAKMIEMIYACEKADEIINNPDLRGDTRVEADFRNKRGVGHIEAPRGLLIHDYTVDGRGAVSAVNMIIATQQNVAAINNSLKEGANALLAEGGDEELLNSLEFLVRCYDPCLACSTHAIGSMELDVQVRQKGEIVRRLRR
ncbi:MAG: Ni/Fe hydrogenase subunit alpha [Desulfotalea sp.]